MKGLNDLKVKIFLDSSDKADMLEMYPKPYIKGFTTNPSLMRKAGVSDYRAFAGEMLRAIPDRPISFEVFADTFEEMERQARQIAGWGPHVYVKIPVTNTRRESSHELVGRLSRDGIKVNVTALMTLDQVRSVLPHLSDATPSYLSLFAGRIADTGVDPVPMIAAAAQILKQAPKAELIWASAREPLNAVQAAAAGCHIITLSRDILGRLNRLGRDLNELSLDTVKTFHEDAGHAGYEL